MDIDPYSPCPGGTGKKIKFCCSDLLPDLDRIGRMFEAGQLQACLQHVERLDRKHPGRACLMGVRAMLLRLMDRLEEAKAAAEAMVARHPDNPVALAELAMALAKLEGGRAALPALEKAIGATREVLEPRVYGAIQMVAEALIAEDQVLPAQVVLLLQAAADPNDTAALELLADLNASTRVPAVRNPMR